MAARHARIDRPQSMYSPGLGDSHSQVDGSHSPALSQCDFREPFTVINSCRIFVCSKDLPSLVSLTVSST